MPDSTPRYSTFEQPPRWTACGCAASPRWRTRLRRHLVKGRGVDPGRILFPGCWKLGQARI